VKVPGWQDRACKNTRWVFLARGQLAGRRRRAGLKHRAER
jgi:hypothetical protein